MEWKTYRVMAQSTGGFIVEAQSEEHAEEMVLDHMHKTGTPFLSGSVEYRESESPYAHPIRLEQEIKDQESLVEEYPEVPEWECQDDEESALTFYEYRQGWIDALEWVKNG